MFENIKKIKTSYLFIIVLAIQICIALVFNLLKFNFGNQSDLNEIPFIHKLLLIIVFAPFFETIIFNISIIAILKSILKNKLVIIILASLIFSLFHIYSLPYVIMTFLGGIFLNTFYLLTKEKKGILISGILTFFIHSIYNLIGFILIEVFNVL